jgi:hypothetical protein
MSVYRGILFRQTEMKMQIDLSLRKLGPYQTEVMIDGKIYTAVVRGNSIYFDNYIYHFYIDVKGTEILIIGKQMCGFFRSFLQWICPCIFKTSFFVLTNKQIV